MAVHARADWGVLVYLLALDAPAPVSIGARPVELPVRAMGADAALAGPLLFIPSPALLGFGAIAASPAVMAGRVWLVAVDGAQLHLAPGTILGHGVGVLGCGPPPSSALPTGDAGASPSQGLKPAPPTTPAPAQPAHADPPQPSKAKGKAPRAVTPDPTA